MKIIYYSIDKQQEWRLTKMKNLLAAGFMFVGGAILMLAEEYANWVPIAGSIIALIGLGMLIYYLFSKDGTYKGN